MNKKPVVKKSLSEAVITLIIICSALGILGTMVLLACSWPIPFSLLGVLVVFIGVFVAAVSINSIQVKGHT